MLHVHVQLKHAGRWCLAASLPAAWKRLNRHRELPPDARHTCRR